jgi:acyl-CoA synthetase (AMP-forming)/AMP-acid ligase II
MTSGPTDLYELVKYMELTHKNVPASLKEVMTTGRALPEELKQKLMLYLPNCDIIDFYGTSEVGAISSISKSEWKMKNKSSGKPEFFVDVIIIDDNRETLEALEVGEICVKSQYTMQGYKFEESLTDQTFIGEYICTGDMGYIDEEGYLFILGRKKEVINRGGFYFYPSELEKNISSIKGVHQATVLPVPNIKWGQVPAAFIVLEESHQHLDEHVIREHIKTKLLVTLPSHKIPEYFVFLSELPINLGGKIDHSRLLSNLTSVMPH